MTLARLRFVIMCALVSCVVACGTSETERAQLASRCATAGGQAFERYKTDLAARYANGADPTVKPEFHYNARIHTCLMQVTHWSFIPPRLADRDLLKEVIDVYANKTILATGVTTRDGDDRLVGDALHFDEEAKRLMSQ